MRATFRVECRRATYYLNRLLTAGIAAEDIRVRSRELRFSVDRRCVSVVKEILIREGASYDVEGDLGVKSLFLRIAKRPFLTVAVFLSLVAVIFFESFVCAYSVKGNFYVNTESVVAVLRENGAVGFAPKGALDLDKIKREIGAIEGVSFASVRVEGNRLRVEIKEELPTREPEIPLETPLVSCENAVVTRVIAESGTPRVSPGDRVEKGALLIEPFYAFTEGGAPAPARGEVWGRVTYVRERFLPAMRVEEVRTGEIFRTRSVTFFGREIGGERAVPFSRYDLEEKVLFRGVGVEIREKVYLERAERTVCHDFDAEGRAYLLAAVSELLLSVPCDARERGVVRATQKSLDSVLHIVLYYSVEQRIDSLALAP